jgi:hypothetical protein
VTTPAAAAARCFSTDEIIPKKNHPPELQATAETKCNAVALATREDSTGVESLQEDLPSLDVSDSFELTEEVRLL